MTVTAPSWDLTATTGECVASEWAPGDSAFSRCFGPVAGRLTFTAECGATGVRDLCARCLDRARGGRLKCSTHEHPVRVVGLQQMGATR
jgi:hypothetical protein